MLLCDTKPFPLTEQLKKPLFFFFLPLWPSSSHSTEPHPAGRILLPPHSSRAPNSPCDNYLYAFLVSPLHLNLTFLSSQLVRSDWFCPPELGTSPPELSKVNCKVLVSVCPTKGSRRSCFCFIFILFLAPSPRS